MRMLVTLMAVLVLFGCAAEEPKKAELGTPQNSEKNLMRFWESHYNEGEKAFFLGNYEYAEKELKLALQNIDRAGVTDERLGKTYHRLGSTYLAWGKLEESEPLLRKALKLNSNALGSENPELLKTLNNLGKLYMAQGNWTNAKPMLTRAVSIGEESLGKTHPELIVPLINLGILHYEQAKFDEAEEYWEDALVVAQMNNNAKQIVIMENMIELYKKTGRDKEAEEMTQRVAILAKKD